MVTDMNGHAMVPPTWTRGVGILSLLFVAASCSSGNSDATTQAFDRTPDDLAAEYHGLVQECMGEKGFDYQIPELAGTGVYGDIGPIEVQSVFLQPDEKWMSAGYGYVTHLLASHLDIAELLTGPSVDPAYEVALYGNEENVTGQGEQPIGGCLGSTLERFPQMIERAKQDNNRLEALDGVAAELTTTPMYADWVVCMQGVEKGVVSLTGPWDLVSQRVTAALDSIDLGAVDFVDGVAEAPGDAETSAEIAELIAYEATLATADIECGAALRDEANTRLRDAGIGE